MSHFPFIMAEQAKQENNSRISCLNIYIYSLKNRSNKFQLENNGMLKNLHFKH